MGNKQNVCPSCRSINVAHYFYGEKEVFEKLMKQVTRHILLYGGNYMTPETPMYHCRDCGHDWNVPHKFPFSSKEPKEAKRLHCVVEDMPGLTKGKIYVVQTIELGAYGIIDDYNEDVYFYNPACFEIVDDEYANDKDDLPDDIAEYEAEEVYDPPYFLHDGYVLSSKFDFNRVVYEAQDGSSNARWGVINYILYVWESKVPAPKGTDLARLYYECLLNDANDEYGCNQYLLLGQALLNGIGCEPNKEEAIKWFHKAQDYGYRLPDVVRELLDEEMKNITSEEV